MKKLFLGVLCACLSSISYAQVPVARTALETLIKPAIKEISVTVSIPVAGSMAFDVAKASQQISNAVSRAYANQIMSIQSLTNIAVTQHRATIPEALLAHEILEQSPLYFYNVGQDDGSLWWAYKAGIGAEQQQLLDAQYRWLRPLVVSEIEKMKQELQLQISSATCNIGKETADKRIIIIEELADKLKRFSDAYLKTSSFFEDSQDALAWLKYYYSALAGKSVDIPAVESYKIGNVWVKKVGNEWITNITK